MKNQYLTRQSLNLSFLPPEEIVDHLHKLIEFAAVNIMRGSIDLDSMASRR